MADVAKRLYTLRVPQLKSIARAFGANHTLTTKDGLVGKILPFAKRYAKQSAYLERARSFWRVDVYGVFLVTYIGLIGGRGLRHERVLNTADAAKALATRLIATKRKQGFKKGLVRNARVSYLQEDEYPNLENAAKAKRAAKKLAKKTKAADTTAVKKGGKKARVAAAVTVKTPKPKGISKPRKPKQTITAVVPAFHAAAATLKRKTTLPGTHKPGMVDKACSITDGNVLKVGDELYDASLNFLDLSINSDKYYTIQVVQTPTEFYTFTHWGRTGTDGQTQNFGPFTEQKEAIDVFLDKFKDKTGQDWSNRANFQQISGKYNLLKNSYSERTAAVWQYYMHSPQDGKAVGWYDYDPDASEIVENVYHQCVDNPTLGIRVVQSGMWMYQVDLAKMTQTNVQHAAHTVRQIRRVASVEAATA